MIFQFYEQKYDEKVYLKSNIKCPFFVIAFC